jgi:hypothetical protein
MNFPTNPIEQRLLEVLRGHDTGDFCDRLWGVPPAGSGHSGSAPSPDGLGHSASVPNADRNTLEDYMAEIDADKPPARCDWCVGVIRRDCSIMGRCVQTGMRRPVTKGRKYG